MFDFVHENKRLVQIILALIILPFALWGVSSYDKSGNAADVVATVNGTKISQKEFENALRTKADLIGINNRNLDTLEINLRTTQHILEDFERTRPILSESGIKAYFFKNMKLHIFRIIPIRVFLFFCIIQCSIGILQ